MNREKEKIENLLKKYKADLNSKIKSKQKSILKSSEESGKVRKEGNALYLQSNHTALDHQEIFKLYSKSVALAPPLSDELATAYYNRSAFFMHVGKCKHGIEDVDKALGIVESRALKIKLLCRKARCFYKWNGTKKNDILCEVRSLLKEVPDDKGALKKLYDDTVAYLTPSNISKIKEDPFVNRFDIDFQAKDKENMYECITVRCDKKNNRYLTANKDFSPGEIIFVEPFYAATLNFAKSYTHCQNCLVPCWSGIPCDHCGWAMFCSEECKTKAMEKFHDVECQLIPHIALEFGDVGLMTFRVSLRILIMAIKDAGSVTKLRGQLKVIDKTLSSNPQDIYMAEKVESNFTSVYSLKPNARAVISDLGMFLLPKVVVCFIKYSQYFEKLNSVDDILKNGNMMFVSTLLMKILKTNEMNNYVIDVSTKNCKHSDDPQGENNSEHKLHCNRGTAFALVDGFLSHSCAPNVRRCITERNRIIIYALKPIKKDSQLFECFIRSFFLVNRHERQKQLLKIQGFKCKCEACVNNWTSQFTDPFKFPRMSEKEHDFSSYLTEIQAFAMMSALNDKPNFKEFIQLISKYLKKACKELDPTCFTLGTMTTMLTKCFEDAYGFNHEVLKCY